MSAGAGKTVARNAAALYAVQLVSYLIPLLEIPVLARALGPTLYGEILFCQALALTLSIFVEYGFNINAAQQVAIHRDSPSYLNTLFSDVLLSKVLISAPMVVTLSALAWAFDVFSSPALLGFVLAYFCAFGFSPMWYFQGMERMGKVAVLDVLLRFAGLCLLFLLVRRPEDFLLALPIMALPPLLNTALTSFWCRRSVGAVRWSLTGAWQQLLGGFHFFIYRSAGNLVLAAAPMMLGLVAGNRVVGEFGPAEKLVRGMTSLVSPFLMAAFPFFSRRLSASGASQSSFKITLGVLFAIGLSALLITLVGQVLGAWALQKMLGSGFTGALDIFAVLVWLAPLRIMNQSVAMLVLIPAGKSHQASYLLSGCSMMAIVLGSCLAFSWQGLGMGAGLLVGEAVLFIAQLYYVVVALRELRSENTTPN
ncbi:hypothetical protein AAV94_11595 [Lampropedia cohaerens]|uniref:Polysaccharide biosynthesis protein n=1 Tax=Lampropedia cohaerens TaxID=1610491 RepID=A0A0U1PXP3_9BURK|nr:oligosaccharide flippase family protein [Lampropedia cohaerens]KKW67226.1 hypothetical protein AAV94_11595 [Lampropedia cohaerens]